MTAETPSRAMMMVLVSRRESITTEVFGRYWKDIHGPLAARLDGVDSYAQWHIDDRECDAWPAIDGVVTSVAPQDRIDGVAELGFACREDLDRYRKVARIMMLDEPNVFRRSVRYVATAGFAPRIVSDARFTGRFGARRIAVLLARRPEVELRDFHRRAEDMFSKAFRAATEVSAFAWTNLEERDNTQNAMLSKNVDHDAPPNRQYNAMLEMEFADALAMRGFFDSARFAETIAWQRDLVARIHCATVTDSLAFVHDGAMTTNGLRGASVASLIHETGAANQLSQDVRQLFATASRNTQA